MTAMFMKTILVSLFMVHLMSSWGAGDSHARDGSSSNLADRMAEEVRETPTREENVQRRFMLLTNLAYMLLGDSMREKVDLFLPRDRHRQIEHLVAHKQFEKAGQLVDEAFVGLSRISHIPLLNGIKKVVFPGDDGVMLTGYLFVPENPGSKAFVFGHGGFGYKEIWMDLMLEVSRQAGVYALAMDFQGCGESLGPTSWAGRIGNFSHAMDYLEKNHGITGFAVGGHSGGGAFPAACSVLENERVSVAVLWDCPFDFYDLHIREGASDPGGNPACLVENMYQRWKKREIPFQPPIGSLDSQESLNDLYRELEATLKKYRHGARLLGEVQKKRPLAVLHIIAEDMIRSLGPAHDGETFFLPPSTRADASRAPFLNRPLPFYPTELFNRPENIWKRWDEELGEPKKTVVIENTTHAFHPPGRYKAVTETVLWIRKHLTEKM